MMRRLNFAIACMLLSVGVFTACVKKDFDAPADQTSIDPMLKVTHTIAQLKAMNGVYNPNTGGDTTVIGQDVVISGIVTANDRSGNFYKQLVIQDSSSAIMMLIDANNLYADYPVGRKIYVKCRNLWLGYDGGNPVLGYVPNEQLGLTSIPQQRVGDFIVKANIGNPVVADTVDLATVSSAQDKYYNRLLYIREAQFDDTTKSYTQPTSTTNRNIKDCAGKTLVVRTSNYSNFASLMLPKGKGAIMGIYTVYISSKATPQLVIRDTSDVRFNGARCGAVSGNILFGENFEGYSKGTTNIGGWINFAEVGNKQYAIDSFGATKYAKISANASGQAIVRSWLITPGITLTGATNPTLTFKTINGYDNGATLKVYISTNYSGSGNPTTATWTQVPATISTGNTTGYASTWTPSGNVNLNAFSGKVYVAFVYDGADPSTGTKLTTTYELDDVYVVAN
ncbi:MAG: choice-of-anchor J domain-containing protein [Bacteroidetes bacterium]|nr:choice-of-anchor J domain-containing protein [Bacteroidota bacterium]